jgi:CelD/BcsL family acetyltransferase involved in cellulose biosynthesis
MNVFTTDTFLEVAAQVFFPGRAHAIEVFRIDGRLLKLLVVDGRVIERMPFYDFPQPLDAWGGSLKEHWYFPRTVQRTTLVSERTPEPPGRAPSPYIDWSCFPDEKAFQAHVAKSAHLKSNDSGRQRRKVERDLGPLKFVWDDDRPEVFETCVKWKSAQYVSTGVGDMFAAPQNVELFRKLKALGVVKVASLSAKDTLLAVHLGSHTDRRFTWWIPAYDAKHSKYSPGRLLLEHLMHQSQAQGDLEFDFLIGDESYKFMFATHNRVIGPMGSPPLSLLLGAMAKRQLKTLLERNPKAMELAREVKRRLS